MGKNYIFDSVDKSKLIKGNKPLGITTKSFAPKQRKMPKVKSGGIAKYRYGHKS